MSDVDTVTHELLRIFAWEFRIMMKYVLYMLHFVQVFSVHTPHTPRMWPNNKYQHSFEDMIENITVKPANSPPKTRTLDKDRIFVLIFNTKDEVDKTMGIIKSHRNLDKKVHQVDYLMRFINNSYERLDKMYENIRRNKDNWDELALLRAYTQVKEAKDSLLQTLADLKMLSKHGFTDRSPTTSPDRSIAWSYYDESSVR